MRVLVGRGGESHTWWVEAGFIEELKAKALK